MPLTYDPLHWQDWAAIVHELEHGFIDERRAQPGVVRLDSMQFLDQILRRNREHFVIGDPFDNPFAPSRQALRDFKDASLVLYRRIAEQRRLDRMARRDPPGRTVDEKAAPKTGALQVLVDRVLADRPNPIRQQQHFTQLPWKLVFMQLVLRVLEPRLIEQNELGFCGVAAVTTLTAKSRPRDYVRFALELLENGEGRLLPGGQLRMAGADVRVFDPATRGGRPIPEADWLVLASLRSDNRVLADEIRHDRVGSYGNLDYRQLVEHIHLAGFERAAGVMVRRNAETVLDCVTVRPSITEKGPIPGLTPNTADTAAWERFVQPGDNFDMAVRFHNRPGWRAILKVQGGLVHPDLPGATEEHYVLLSKVITNSPEEVSSSVYSWGAKYKELSEQPKWFRWRPRIRSLTLTRGRFLERYYGFVAVKVTP